MADRELRRMNRTELIEIIFALKQSEDALKTENAALTAQLEDRQIHLRHAGSIARASLELNHVFESAQSAADDYLASIQSILHEARDSVSVPAPRRSRSLPRRRRRQKS